MYVIFALSIIVAIIIIITYSFTPPHPTHRGLRSKSVCDEFDEGADEGALASPPAGPGPAPPLSPLSLPGVPALVSDALEPMRDVAGDTVSVDDWREDSTESSDPRAPLNMSLPTVSCGCEDDGDDVEPATCSDDAEEDEGASSTVSLGVLPSSSAMASVEALARGTNSVVGDLFGQKVKVMKRAKE